MHQIRFSLLGDPTSLPKPLAAFKGPTSNGRGREREGQEKGEGGNGREERATHTAAAFGYCF